MQRRRPRPDACVHAGCCRVQRRGKKVLVLDPRVSGFLGQLAEVPLLREHGVEQCVFYLCLCSCHRTLPRTCFSQGRANVSGCNPLYGHGLCVSTATSTCLRPCMLKMPRRVHMRSPVCWSIQACLQASKQAVLK